MKKLMILMLLTVVAGCCPKCGINEQNEIHTEYITQWMRDSVRDSIYVHDSVWVQQKGDTMWIEKYKTLYRDRLRDVIKRDTIVKRDSVLVTVTKEVAKKPSLWARLQLVMAGVLTGSILAGVWLWWKGR